MNMPDPGSISGIYRGYRYMIPAIKILRNKTCISLAVLLFFCPALSGRTHDSDPFRVALTGKYPPFSMYDSDGELIGFDVDVSREIAMRLDRELQLVATEWDGILPGLLAGKYDAIIGSMAITEERKKQVTFSEPYYQSGAQLFIHRNLSDTISSIEDCTSRRIGVVLGETFERFLTENFPDIDTVTYKSTVDIFRDVENGRLAGFVSDRLLGAYQIKTMNMPFVPAGNLLYRESMGIPVKRENESLLANINKALAEARAAGVIDTLFEKWFGLQQSAPTRIPAASPVVDQSSHPGGKTSEMKTATIVKMLGYGFALTLFIAVFSILFGFLIAVPEGLLLNRPDLPGYFILRTFNDFIRGTPVLIQLFFVYFGVAGWLAGSFGFQVSAVSAAIFTLSINASAYMAEVVRSGLMAVDPGQKEAARALGLTSRQTFFSVVWPQAFRIALPPLMNSVVALIKDTALVSVITVPEVIRQAQSIISVTFNPTKFYLITAVMFFIVTFPLMKLADRMETHIRDRGFTHA
jgi:arginine/lysine/histidine/glutamine transport system substrate-binding and permease protein